MKKLLSLLLAMLMLTLPAMTAFADDGEAVPAESAILFRCSVTPVAAGGGVLRITFVARSFVSCDTLGVTSYYVQQQNSAGGWTTVTGSLPGSTGSGTTYSFSRDFYGAPNNTFRVVARFTATADGVTETSTVYSSATFARSIIE